MQISSVQLREYEKIFSGTNQEDGYENIFLGFTTNEYQQTLKQDKTTYFHYPNTAETYALIDDVSLINAGAIPGPSPFKADRISKFQGNYKQYKHWGDANGIQTGVWLCAWLSGNPADPNCIPVWKDRWYNPGYIDAISATYVYSNSAVYDEDSIITFDPGVVYRYAHIGDTYNETLVNMLTGSLSALKVHLTEWQPLCTVDNTGFGNNAIIVNENSATYITDKIIDKDVTCVNFNGINQYGKVLYNNTLDLTGNMTVSFWVKSNDWNNIKGSQLVSRNFRGGWDVKFSNGFSNPLIAIFDTSNVCFANIDGTIYNVKSVANASFSNAMVDDDLYVWVLDDNTKRLYKIDYNGDILNFYNTDIYGITATQVSQDINKNLNITFNGVLTSFYITINKETLTQTNIASLTANSICYDLTGGIIAHNYDKAVVDNNNVLWYLDNGMIYNRYNSLAWDMTVINQLTACKDFDIDSNNNVWIVFDNLSFGKFDNNGLSLSGVIGDVDFTNNIRKINITNEYDNGNYKDFIWITQTDEKAIYKIDQSGELVTKLDFSQYNVLPSIVVNTYDWHRKFDYLQNNRQSYIASNLWMNTTGSTLLSGVTSYTHIYPTSGFDNDSWHLLSFTFDAANNIFNFYVDSVLRSSINTDTTKSLFHRYENAIYIGSNSGKIEHLGRELGNSNAFYFSGAITDLRVYNCILNEHDLWNIYTTKCNYKDILWNMKSGRKDYVEEIEKFFKMKMPGLKTSYFNLRIIGLNITDINTRTIIEDIIRDSIKKMVPGHTELYKIIWE